jgi:hypothetical protein
MTTAINFRTNPGQLEKAHGARYAIRKDRPTFYRRAGQNKIAKLQLPENVVVAFSMLTSPLDKKMRNDYVVALVGAGWTQASVARASKLSPQMIRVILNSHTSTGVPPTLFVPPVPKHAPKVGQSRYVMPTPELLARLKELKPYAQQVRANSPRFRAEAEEYTYLLNQAHNEQKVTLYRLAKLLEVTTSALAFRLVRYGYRTTALGKSSAYKTILDKNRSTV